MKIIYQSVFALGAISTQAAPHNFGVVITNQDYAIYRSAALGDTGLEYVHKTLEKEGLSKPATIIYMNSAGYKFLDFALEEYYLQDHFNYKFYHPFGPIGERTYVDGHTPYYPSKDVDSDAILGQEARELFVKEDDGVDGGIEDFLYVLKLILDPANQPVLFHCLGGRHRTGMVAMALRYIQGGHWVNGPKVTKWSMPLNPAQLEYYNYNKLMFRYSNIGFIEMLAQDERFLQLKEQYGPLLRDGSELGP